MDARKSPLCGRRRRGRALAEEISRRTGRRRSGALICAPLNKDGHYVARMVVSQKTPRHWEPWEVDVVTRVANRCWESVQRRGR